MEKCPNCGNKLTNINVLCPECGKLVVVIQLDSDHSVKTINIPQDMISINASAIHDDAAEKPLLSEDKAPYSPVSSSQFAYNVDEDVYTEDYLDTIRNMPLPELDDLSDFDPEAFLREYQKNNDKKKKSQTIVPMDIDVPPSDAQASEEKNEIHEEQEDLLDIETAEITQEESFTDSSDSEDKGEDATKRSVQSKEKQQTKSIGMLRKRRIALPLAILLWAAAAAVLFFAFVYADNYAKTHYQGVNNMFYEISDGNLDLSGAMSEDSLTME